MVTSVNQVKFSQLNRTSEKCTVKFTPPSTIMFSVGKYIEYQLKYDPLTGAWSITKNKTCIDQLADLLKETQLS